MSKELVVVEPREIARAGDVVVPAMVMDAGKAATFAYTEFFGAQVENENTLRAYHYAVTQFLHWCEDQRLVFTQIGPADVGRYIKELSLAKPSKKLHLAALRKFFDVMVVRHAMILNPATSVTGPRYSVNEGKTNEFSMEQVAALLAAVDTSHVVGLRDRAVITTLLYTAARVGAVAKLNLKDYFSDGNGWFFRMDEKGGKARVIPVRSDLHEYLQEYLQAASLLGDPGDTPLFRCAKKKARVLTSERMKSIYIWYMLKRRLRDAGLPVGQFSCHSFRATTATELLKQKVPLEDVQYLLGHADPRTTRIYDKQKRQVTRNIVERIPTATMR